MPFVIAHISYLHVSTFGDTFHDRERIVRRRAAITISVRDDGRGFDVGGTLEGAAAEGHLGVIGMRERVRAHGGTFQVTSSPGMGTTVTVDIPFEPDSTPGASAGSPGASPLAPAE